MQYSARLQPMYVSMAWSSHKHPNKQMAKGDNVCLFCGTCASKSITLLVSQMMHYTCPYGYNDLCFTSARKGSTSNLWTTILVQCFVVTCRRFMYRCVIESHMREHHTKTVEVVLMLSAPKRATVIAESQPKTKKVVAYNHHFKAPQPLPPPLASARTLGSASSGGGNCSMNNHINGNGSSRNSSSGSIINRHSNSNNSCPGGSKYYPSGNESAAGPRVLTLHSQTTQGKLLQHGGTKAVKDCDRPSANTNPSQNM